MVSVKLIKLKGARIELSYQKLLQTVLQYDATDLVMINKLLQQATDFTDMNVIEVVNKLPDFENIFHDVNALDPVEKIRFLSRLERVAVAQKTTIPSYIPPTTANPSPTNDYYFNRRDIVRVLFGGVGTEPDAPHFGLVWVDNPYMSDIVVIPTTSQYTMDYPGIFSVGQFSSLSKLNTIVQIHKMTNISRKRIVSHHGKILQGRVHSSYNDRLLHGIALVHGGENSLYDHVRNKSGMLLPDNLRLFESMRFWPVRDVLIDPATNILHFRKWNEVTMQTLQMKPPKPNPTFTYKKRLNIFDKAFGKPADRASGHAQFSIDY